MERLYLDKRRGSGAYRNGQLGNDEKWHQSIRQGPVSVAAE